MVERFPRPDWKSLNDYIRRRVEQSGWDAAYRFTAITWLQKVAGILGDGYHVTQSKHFLLLSAQTEDNATHLLNFCEGEQLNLIQQFPGVAKQDGYGPRVVLIFNDPEDYYSYIAYFYPEEGRFAGSGGIFISRGYRHIALPFVDISQACKTLRHEIIHACISHLPLPLWLDEGFTNRVERVESAPLGIRRIPITPVTLDARLVHRHHRFWNAERIQKFWSGESFGAPGDNQELSYNLAEVLVDIIVSDWGHFPEFFCAANRRDAGESAALEHLGASLGDIVANFLGDGYWTPELPTERN